MSKKISIIKVGGKLVEDHNGLNLLLEQFSHIKNHKILVHGGGRSATSMAHKMGIETKMIDGRRVTNQEMLEVAIMVYGGLVNKSIVARLQAMGINAMGMTGADLNYLQSVKRPVKDIDYGFVGDITKVRINELSLLLSQNIVPVLSPLSHDGNGNMLNVNADTIAAEVAVALSEKYETELIYCFEKPGVLEDADDDTSLIPQMDVAYFWQLKEAGAIHEGMIPKLENSFNAKKRGVEVVRITNVDKLAQGGTVLL